MASLPEIHAWCEQARPLFISGLARSGTSMLQVAFARHSAMYDIKNCRETHIFVRPHSAMAEPVHVPTKRYLRGREHLMAYRHQVKDLQATNDDFSEADLIRTFFWYASTDVYAGRQPLEKTPSNIKKIPMIFELFPNARVVVCSRNPVDVVASYRKRLKSSRAAGMSEAQLKWLDKTPDEMLKVFRRFTRLVEEAQPEYGHAMFMAPYEWLVGSPTAALRQICDWAGLPFETALVRPGASNDAAQADADDDAQADAQADAQGDDEGNDEDDDTLEESPHIQKRESDAHTVMTPDEIEMIKKGTKKWMNLWNTPGPLGEAPAP